VASKRISSWRWESGFDRDIIEEAEYIRDHNLRAVFGNWSFLKNKLEEVWDTLYHHGVDKEMLIAQGLLSPATCCLVNPDGARTVEKAFAVVRQLSTLLRDEYVK